MRTEPKLAWNHLQAISPKSYICGYCGSDVAPDKGWFSTVSHLPGHPTISICHRCTRPTFHDIGGEQIPGVTAGNPVEDINDAGVASLYQEARVTLGAGSYTAAVLCCRKLLMHIAVSKGAKEGESFISYVEFLASKNYVPPDAKDWVDHIRKKGNEANHEITIMNKTDAEELLSFSEMLLKLVFEFPASIKKKLSKPKS